MRQPTHADPTTPEELFEEEIAELERPMLHSFLPWVASLGVLILVSGLLAFFFILAPRRGAPRETATSGGVSALTLAEPNGHLKGVPALFRWEPVAGASSYVVTVTEGGDSSKVILLRLSDGTKLSPTDTQTTFFKPGLYSWTVEARGSDGASLARGEAAFVLSGT